MLHRMTVAPATVPPPALAEMELFLGLSAEALADVAACARARHIGKDTVVFSQGAEAAACHALLDGRVRVTQSDEAGAALLVRFIGPGEMFGTVALFTDRQYPAEAVTVLDSIEVCWSEAALLGLIGRHPLIALNMVRIIGARLREVQERLREVAFQRVERRIAHALLRLAAHTGQPAEEPTTIAFPLTRRNVADMCGATLHTASRVLTAWEKAGLIATRRQRVTIRDLAGIQQVAEDSPH
jgi:CRP/FNR family transcriptional regulator, nitrogen oxide reductase regulator